MLLPSLLISPLRMSPLHNLCLSAEEEKFLYFRAYVPLFMLFLLVKMIFPLSFENYCLCTQTFSNASYFLKSSWLPVQSKLNFLEALFIPHSVVMITESHDMLTHFRHHFLPQIRAGTMLWDAEDQVISGVTDFWLM